MLLGGLVAFASAVPAHYALAAIGAGAAAILAGLLWPSPLVRRAPGASAALLDAEMPACQFFERHVTVVRASPGAVAAALRAVTPREIRCFRLFTWLRRPRIRTAPPSILAAPPDAPLLDTVLGSGFELVGETPEREIVIGLQISAAIRAVMNFEILRDRDGIRLSTETRVRAANRAAMRAFAVYWRVIYPGSALLRITWLRAIRRRAERSGR